MKYERFEDLHAWQKAKNLTFTIHKSFNDCKDSAFKEQIKNTSVSIMNSIAEGFERKSEKEFKRYLLIAKGNAKEVITMINFANDLGYINLNNKISLINLVNEISKILTGLIKTL